MEHSQKGMLVFRYFQALTLGPIFYNKNKECKMLIFKR